MLKFFLLSNLHLQDINPRECGIEDCSPDFNVGPTAREYFLLHYVFSGSGTFTISGKDYTVSKGQIFVLRPHEIVYYKTDPENPWDYCWVGFECGIPTPDAFEQHVITIPAAEHIFMALKNCDKNPAGKEYYISGKVLELFSLLEQSTVEKKSKSYQNITRAKDYIDANYVNPITVETLAEYLGINRSYFSTSFKKAIGCSPQQYIVDVRLSKAAELITTQGYSASAAALSTGYTDIFNFSKMFKRKYGLSPTAYAKAKKAERSGE